MSITEDSAGPSDQYGDRISVKIPPFWKKNVSTWFLQVESQFIKGNITSESVKYHYLLGSLDEEAADIVSDLISKPLSATPYADLRHRLLQEFEDPDTQKIRKLLCEVELGDKKPSVLLQEMRSLVGNKISDDNLKILFLWHLPKAVQRSLAVSSDDLTTIALKADKIMNVSQPKSLICALL